MFVAKKKRLLFLALFVFSLFLILSPYLQVTGEILPAGLSAIDVPVNLLPVDSSVDISLNATLVSSVFSDLEERKHLASNWQISRTQDFSDMVYDSGIDKINLTRLTLKSNILDLDTNYYWRVSYQNDLGIWSDWSIETLFKTLTIPVTVSGDLYLGDRVKTPFSPDFGNITWIVVAHNHYTDEVAGLVNGNHVTLLSEDLVSIYEFDNSTYPHSWGNNNWGDSGLHSSASKGIRPWLNSDCEPECVDHGFYNAAFSDIFRELFILQTKLPNKDWKNGNSYITNDKVFIPSQTELGNSSGSFAIGSVFEHFNGNVSSEWIAKFSGTARRYWTRSPFADYECYLRVVSPTGRFSYERANNTGSGVRPVINLKADVPVDFNISTGIYDIVEGARTDPYVISYTVGSEKLVDIALYLNGDIFNGINDSFDDLLPGEYYEIIDSNVDFTVFRINNIYLDNKGESDLSDITLTFKMESGLNPTTYINFEKIKPDAFIDIGQSNYLLGSEAGLDVKLTHNGWELNEIKDSNNNILLEGTDYIVVNNDENSDIYSFLPLYLDKQDFGDLSLTFYMENEANPVALISILPGSALLTPLNSYYSLLSGDNVFIELKNNGRMLEKIVSGADELDEGVHYNVDGDLFSIESSFFDDHGVGKVILNFEMDGGNNPKANIIITPFGTQALGSLELNFNDDLIKVVDPNWEWQYRTDSNYSYVDGDITEQVNWIVVSKDHYNGDDDGEVTAGVDHITLMSEKLIGLYAFDDSTNFHSWGYNNWSESGIYGENGLRKWLNSTDKYKDNGFYSSFEEYFKDYVLTTILPNRDWEEGASYFTSDKVFIPSQTELGGVDTETFSIGSSFSLFSNSNDNGRIAKLSGFIRNYWTRSPSIQYSCYLRGVNSAGRFDYFRAYNGTLGVRPVINLRADALISLNQVDGAYQIIDAGYGNARFLHEGGLYEYLDFKYNIFEDETVDIFLEPMGRLLERIVDCEGNELKEGLDYFVNDNQYKILPEYLDNKGVGIFNFTFIMSGGNTNPEATIFISPKKTRTIGSLNIGDVVVDDTWEWQYKTGDNYSGGGEIKSVSWVLVAINHYIGDVTGSVEDDLGHVTLISENIIGKNVFDSGNSNNMEKSGSDFEGRGVRKFLNGSSYYAYFDTDVYDITFYDSFSKKFKNKLVKTNIPNKLWNSGASYFINDYVFLPSKTELGGDDSDTYEIASDWGSMQDNSDRRSILPTLGAFNYWTRSPLANSSNQLIGVGVNGSFQNQNADNPACGIRPVVNVKDITLVDEEQTAGVYKIRESATIQPQKFNYMIGEGDFEIILSANGWIFNNKINDGISDLSVGDDYTTAQIGDNYVVTIKSDYLEEMEVNESIFLKFEMDGGVDPILEITYLPKEVEDAIADPLIIYHVYEDNLDIEVILVNNGWKFNALRDDNIVLIEGVDYSIEGSVFNIKADYLNGKGISDFYLTFEMSGGNKDPKVYVVVSPPGSRAIGSLNIGDVILDNTKRWALKTGNNYTGTISGSVIAWILVAKDHYEDVKDDMHHVTLLSDELIALYTFDNSTYPHAWGHNNWEYSGTHKSTTMGVRPWLNNTFYNFLSKSVREKVLKTKLVGIDGEPYSEADNVFLPSERELGGQLVDYSGTEMVYPYFKMNSDTSAFLGDNYYKYWTRSPDKQYICFVRNVTLNGKFDYERAYYGNIGVRPVINIKLSTPVYELEKGYYALTRDKSIPFLFGDIDNDGNENLIFSTEAGTYYTYWDVARNRVMLGNGGNPITLPAMALAFDDINNDGKGNLVVSTEGGVYWSFWDGSKVRWTRITGNPSLLLTFGDINNDGKKNLLFSTEGGTYYCYWDAVRNRVTIGNGGSPITNPSSAIIFGDINNDGIDNIVVSTTGVYWGYWDGSRIRWGPRITANNSVALAFADINNDGNENFIFSTPAGTFFTYWDGSRPRLGNSGQPITLPAGIIKTGDINIDGKDNVVVSTDGGIYWSYWDGSRVRWSPAISTNPAITMQFGDINNDGMDELAFSTEQGTYYSFWDAGLGRVRLGNSRNPITLTSAGIIFGDINNSGNENIVVTTDQGTFYGYWDGSRVRWESPISNNPVGVDLRSDIFHWLIKRKTR